MRFLTEFTQRNEGFGMTMFMVYRRAVGLKPDRFTQSTQPLSFRMKQTCLPAGRAKMRNLAN